MSRPASSAPVLGGFLLVAGVLQFMATVALGQARTDQLARAAAEGARMYLLGGLATLVGLVGVWTLRRRPLVAVGVLIAWQAAIVLPLRTRTTRLGLAYHGEFVLHHFTTLLAVAICVVIALEWLRRTELPQRRVVPVVLVLTGTAVAVVAHLWTSRPEHGGASIPGWAAPGAPLLLSAWVLTPLLLWDRLGPPTARAAALLVALPLVTRLALSGIDGFTGGIVPPPGRAWVMATVVVSGAGVFILMRPRLARGLWVLVTVSSFVAVAMLYLLYRHGFGDLEDDLGGLAVSVFGFVPAYPPYVAPWQSIAVMLGLFGLFNAAYACLIARDERPRGVALGLMVVSGIGLTSPQLWLMTAAAGLLFCDSLMDGGVAAKPPARPLEDLLHDVATRLGLPPPVVLEAEAGAILCVRGELAGRAVELRARPLPREAWSMELSVGVHGRQRADMELIPDRGTDGARPAHVLARTHAVRGPRGAAEALDDAMLDALIPLPDARVQLWSAGARVQMGADLSGMTAGGTASLVRALVRRDLD